MFHKGSASDKTILKKVNRRLARVSLGAHSRVTAAVRNAQVTLSGSIQYENQRRPALRAASGVDGVSGVLDQLQVQSRDAQRR
jgi:osmotically-inducible protein OsmY